jgi:membrane protein DedA with SNARE-associated domain
LFLGFVKGTITSTIGMTVYCTLGYWIGAKFGRPVALKLVGEPELMRLENLTNRFGYWAVAMSRAVPVLGEASVLGAGMSRMPMPRFLLVSVLSCLGISAVYGAAGAFSAKLNSFVFAFCAAILLSALGMLIMSRVERSNRE